MNGILLAATTLAVPFACSAAWADVMIGLAGSRTGPDAAFGTQLQEGAEPGGIGH